MALQRLAAGLVAITHGLDGAHIGTICDALTAAGVDPSVWSAHAVNDKLNTDMRVRGSTWPDHIANPGAFLASRLRRLSWTPPGATQTKVGGCAAASLDQTPTPVVLTAASRARIAAAQHEIRRVLRERTHHTTAAHTGAYALRSLRPRPNVVATNRSQSSGDASPAATTTPPHRRISDHRPSITEDAQPRWLADLQAYGPQPTIQH